MMLPKLTFNADGTVRRKASKEADALLKIERQLWRGR